MKNPLCKYDKYLDAVEFLKNNFVCYSDRVFVPYAKECYFSAPLFSKFNFCLNFTDDAPFYFWKIFKEDRDLLTSTVKNFTELPIEEDRELFEQIMFKEKRPLFKALLFAILTQKEIEEKLKSSLLLDLNKITISKNCTFDYSDFIIQSCVDNFSVNNHEMITNLNNFKSKVVIANNPVVADFISYKHKIDFEDCYLLVSTR